MRRHLHRYATHYVCDYDTLRALHGPMTSDQAVAWIRAQGDVEAQSKYCNASRYALAKHKVYPRNAAGDQKLQEDLDAPAKENHATP